MFSHQRIVYAPGVFDLLHEGHLNFLEASKAMGDRLIVGVVSDAGAEAYKRRPWQHEQTRLRIIRSLSCVDYAVLQQTTDPTRELEVVRPHVLTHGDDWDRLREGHASLERLGIEFRLVPYTIGVSTSQLIALLHRGTEVT